MSKENQDFVGPLKKLNPLKWLVRGFKAGGLTLWEELLLDAILTIAVLSMFL